MTVFTRDVLIAELKRIQGLGWIKNKRKGNQGGIGNTLEDLLGIQENNLAIPDAGDYELKTQRLNTAALTTLFHSEPLPRKIRFVPRVLLPKYGWPHQEAGTTHPTTEMSFRQTINALARSDRGFGVQIDRRERKVLVSFNAATVDAKHSQWLKAVTDKIGLAELSPQPYWAFDDLTKKVSKKLLNCVYVQADVKKEDGEEYYHFSKATMLQQFSFDKFLLEMERGNILVDFDARTGHNHGTKFRLRQTCFANLYESLTEIF